MSIHYVKEPMAKAMSRHRQPVGDDGQTLADSRSACQALRLVLVGVKIDWLAVADSSSSYYYGGGWQSFLLIIFCPFRANAPLIRAQ